MPETDTCKFFDSYAESFSAIYGNKNSFLNTLVNRYFRKSMKLRYFKTLDGCEPLQGKSVIDIGCGPGHYGIALAARGAKNILGIDFSKSMVELAERNAERHAVRDKCTYVCADFLSYEIGGRFDYSIVMGFMDYIKEPESVIGKTLSATRSKAFFSFPSEGGILAFQRKLRYQSRCDLFMYDIRQLNNLFKGQRARDVQIEKISRDFFVTVFME